MKIKLFMGLLFFLFSLGVQAHQEPTEVNLSPSTGPGMAVLEASPGRGFKLSEKAWKRLGLGVNPLEPAAPFTIPPNALIHYQDKIGVYRLREGWFRLVTVKILHQTTDHIKIQSEELQSGDGIATQGVGFLRVADMELSL